MNLFPVFSRHLMRQLEKSGFVVVKIAPNYIYKGQTVYYFEETPELRKLANELVEKRRLRQQQK